MSTNFSHWLSTNTALNEVTIESERRPERTREARRDVEMFAAALFDDNTACSLTVLNLSYDGCRVETSLAILPGTQFTLSVLGLGKMRATVRWYRNGLAGLSFREETSEVATKICREHERASLQAEILVRRSLRNNYYVRLNDVSPSGCSINFVDRPSVGERHWIKFEGMESLEGEVRWVEGFTAGMKFVRPIHPAVFELLLSRLR